MISGYSGLEGTGVIAKLVTARFLVLLLHLVATCTLFYGKVPLIHIELDPRKSLDERIEQYQYIDTWMTALLALAIILMAVEFAGVLSGYTLHQKNGNAFSGLAHLVGFLSTTSMVLNGWTVRVYPSMFTFCSLLPAGFDASWWALQTCTRKFRRR